MDAFPFKSSRPARWFVAACIAGLHLGACSSDNDAENPLSNDGAAGAPSGVAGTSANDAGSAGFAGTPQHPAVNGRYDFIQLAAGQRHTCARLIDGRVKCWGQNGGWLGVGDYEDRGDQLGEMGSALPAVNLGTDWVADSVSTRDLAVCVTLHSGAVKCWGVNSRGELGAGDMVSRGGEPSTLGDALKPVDLGQRGRVIEVAVGANHVCARTEAGLVICWGANDFGQLGRGDTLTRGDEPGEMGSLLEPVPLGTGRTAIQLAAGWFHTCALLDDHTVKCWGNNPNGELGQGDIEPRGDEPDELGDALLPVDLGTGVLVREIAAGEQHNCAVLEDRRVKCWGANDFLQLGNGSRDPRGDSPNQLGDALPCTDLGPDFPAKALALGAHHSCALSTNGAVKCWGLNASGQLGIGTTADHGAPAETMGVGLPSVDFGASRRALAIAVGMDFSCAAMDDGQVVCWGDNQVGQLGIGNTENRGVVPTQLGLNFLSTVLD